MKLRFSGNSIRFRILQSELARLAQGETLEAAIVFTADAASRITYALEPSNTAPQTTLRYAPNRIAVLLPKSTVAPWAKSNEVGLYTTLDIAPNGTLDILIEKDFACLDLSDAENVDTFPNPNTAC